MFQIYAPWPRLFGVAIFLLLAGCGRQSAPVVDPNLQITIQPPTNWQTSNQLVVQVVNLAGEPLANAQVSIEGNMNHGGMAPVFSDAVADGDDGQVDGHYAVPFAFNMLGDWILTVTVEKADGNRAVRNLDVAVREQQVTIAP